MEGQGEAMLEPEGETYDESQVISLLNTKHVLYMSQLYFKVSHGSRYFNVEREFKQGLN